MKLGGNWIGLMSERRDGDSEGFVKNIWFQNQILEQIKAFYIQESRHTSWLKRLELLLIKEDVN
jgi:hypothetical protein